MTTEQLMIQQQNWHDEFQLKLKEYDQRDRHWWWQRGVWIASIGIAMGALLVKGGII